MKRNILVALVIIGIAFLIVYTITLSKKHKYQPQKQSDPYTDYLKNTMKYGDEFLSKFSIADRKTLYELITEYSQKGRKVKRTDPIYNDVMRIKSYAPELYITNIEA